MSEQLQPVPAKDRDLSVVSMVLAALAVIGAVVAIGLGVRALTESQGDPATVRPHRDHRARRHHRGRGGGSTVTLTEFAIDPASVSADGSIHVMNGGEVVHNLAVEGTDLITPDLDAGEMADLELTDLEPGSLHHLLRDRRAPRGRDASGVDRARRRRDAPAEARRGAVTWTTPP